jgi:hypothetical protein
VKKTIFILIFCSACYYQTLAQLVVPKFGLNMSTVDFSEALSAGRDIKNKYGFLVGFGVECSINKFLAIQPELLFHEKGWVETYTSVNYSEKMSYRLNYIEVPLMAKLKYKNFYLHGGPFAAFGIRGRYKYSREENGQHSAGHKLIRYGPNQFTSKYEYVDNGFDYGFQGGVGFKIFDRVYVEVRYSKSLLNIYSKGTGYTNDNKSQNKGFQLTVGFPSPRN